MGFFSDPSVAFNVVTAFESPSVCTDVQQKLTTNRNEATSCPHPHLGLTDRFARASPDYPLSFTSSVLLPRSVCPHFHSQMVPTPQSPPPAKPLTSDRPLSLCLLRDFTLPPFPTVQINLPASPLAQGLCYLITALPSDPGLCLNS